MPIGVLTISGVPIPQSNLEGYSIPFRSNPTLGIALLMDAHAEVASLNGQEIYVELEKELTTEVQVNEIPRADKKQEDTGDD